MKIKEENGNVVVKGLREIQIRSLKEAQKILQYGQANRQTAETNVNLDSSRSHSIFNIRLVFQMKRDTANGGSEITELCPKFSLVDLAGSERVKKSQVSAHRLDEAKKINFSLAALGNCIHALTDSKSHHVPFRDSKLTRILSDSLGGNSKTALVVTIGPAKDNVEESLMSLQFAQRAMKVENAPVINKKIDYRILNF